MAGKSTINREEILHFIKSRSARPLRMREIAEALDIHKNESRTLKRILRSLTDNGEIFRTRSGCYGPAEKMNLITGAFQAHRDGYGFVIPEQTGEKDIFIPARRTMGAMSGDRVIARVERPVRRDGSIIKILERSRSRVIGELCRDKNVFYVRPKGKNIPFFIIIPPKYRGKAKKGDTVSAEITSFPTASSPPEGKILKVLPPLSEPRQEIDMIIEEYSLSRRFAPKVNAEVREMSADAKSGRRRDCRKLLTVTIDGESAKDFDDAVSIKKDGEDFILYVHIADVGHYIPWDSALDLEARRRGTSVYFPGSVIPMLPERLSNDLCSLVPHQDRLTFTAELRIDKSGAVTEKSFYPSIINSNERMTYTNVKKILADHDVPLRGKYGHLLKDLETMEELCHILRKQRMNRGSLDFDLPEPEIILDICGNPEAILKAERNMAHMIIEEFMITANEAVASYIEETEAPSIYRVHEKPDTAKIEELLPVFRACGLNIRRPGPGSFHSILRQIKGKDEESMLNILLLRSLKQAKYATENIGHFGLASSSYTHFTSPIRRYPDLVVHRILRYVSSGKGLSGKNRKFLDAILPDIASLSSKSERTADEAEREIVNAMRVWFMKDRTGNEYKGVITNITSHGLRIQLRDIFVEGFLHVSSMQDDYYRFDEKHYRLTGRRKRRSFALGQQVTVQIEKVNIEEREIILRPA